MANTVQRTAAQVAALAPIQLVAGRTGDIELVIADIVGLSTALSGLSDDGHTHAISDITDLQTTLDGKASSSALTTKADLVGGVIPASQLPALAISAYLGTAANQAAMLAKVGQRGDWCNRVDTGTTWILGDDDYTLLGSWVELNYPGAPVTSVNGYTGSFSLTASDVDAQPEDATLTALAALSLSANKLIYATGDDTFSTTDFTALARTLAAHTTISQYKVTLELVAGTDFVAPTGSGAGLTGITSSQISGLGTLAVQNANSVTISGGSIAGITDLAIADGGTGASNQADARTNLGLGSIATQDASSVIITGGTITGLSTPSSSTDAATKGYVDGLVSSPMNFKSATDCSTNPNYPSATKGDVYVVSVAGKIGGASGVSVDIGDLFLATANNVGGTQAGVGTSWTIIEHNLQGALLAANNLSDVASASAALANLGGQAASGSLTATITTSTPSNLTAGVMLANGTDVDSIAYGAVSRVFGINSSGVLGWYQVSADMIPVGSITSSLITNGTIVNGDIHGGAAIDITKLGTGVVSTTVFNYLVGVTSAIQTQIDSKLSSSGNGSALTGITNTQVSGLGTMATQNAGAVAITGGTITGLGTPSGSTDAATKGYVDGLVSSPMNFKSATDCSANPNYPSATKGDTYAVSVAGKIGGASGVTVEVGDLYLATANNAGGTQASVGTSWTLIEHNLQGALLSANNLSDLADASTARTNLGLAIGTNEQAYSAQLTSAAAVGDGIVVHTAANTFTPRTIAGTTNVITVTNGSGVGGDPTITVGSLVQRTDTVAVLTKQQNFGAVALTSSSASIAWNLDNAQSAYHVMTENTTLANPTNMVAGATYVLAVVNHASSPKTLAFGSAYKWITADTHTIPATNGSKSLFTFYCYNGTEMWCVSTLGFA